MFILQKVTIKLGCSSCTRPKLSDVFIPKPKPKPSTKSGSSHRTRTRRPTRAQNRYSSSGSSSMETSTTTFSSSEMGTMPAAAAYYSSDTESDVMKSLRAVQGFGRVGEESVAVETDSHDPYLDFRRSMLEMILENEMYSKNDLKELLNCFLQLNSPEYHGIIVRAFTEIWNGVFW